MFTINVKNRVIIIKNKYPRKIYGEYQRNYRTTEKYLMRRKKFKENIKLLKKAFKYLLLNASYFS